MNAIRQHLEPLLLGQREHAVDPRIEVLWEEPCTLESVTVRLGGIITTMPPQKVLELKKHRDKRILKGGDGSVVGTDPVRHIYAPEEYRQIILQCVRKRLENPGVQLWLWVNGGIRSAKTEFCMWVLMAHFWWTRRAWCWAFHETETTSRTIQQERAFRYIPEEVRRGKYRKDMQTKFNYTPGSGFTGSEFYMLWDAHHEGGCLNATACTHDKPCMNRRNDCGGRMEFRFYGQDEGTMVGQELTMAVTDEKVTPNIIKLVDDRLLTRAADTREEAFLNRMLDALHRLERGEWLPIPLLGAVFQGWLLNGFTPKWGWTSTVKMLLQKATKYGWYDPTPMVQRAMQEAVQAMPTPELRAQKADELQARPWTLGGITRVPRFAQPQMQRALVSYLPTYANKFKGNWAGAVQSMQGKPIDEIKRTLFGDVEKDVASLFLIDPEKHYREESSMPRDATLYIVADPAPAKPWSIKWYLVDPMERRWVVQEWPCETWEIPGHGLPGPWAVASESDRMNGDAGPAQQLRLGWSCDWVKMTWLLYTGCQRLAKRLRAVHGAACQVRMQTMKLAWPGRPDLTLDGELALPVCCYMDSRFAGSPTATQGSPDTTALEQMQDVHNALPWDAASGGRVDEGYMLMASAFGTEVAGIPELVCVKECTNTQFAWEVWTPNGRQDEACKDIVDPDRYFLGKAEECGFVNHQHSNGWQGGGSF